MERVVKPKWLKVPLPGSERYHAIKRRASELSLATVCQEARCPNIGECWAEGTATFMVMGDTCTRACRFCAVKTGKRPPALDANEPHNLAQAVAEMGLDYVVVTSVDRDDQPDFGAAHFAACVNALRARCPQTRIEVLVPDFQGLPTAVETLAASRPDVIGHNVETVRSLTRMVRDPRSSYDTSLEVLRLFKQFDSRQLTKSSIMVGVGEAPAEVEQTMVDLLDAGVDFLTIGQYLQPSKRHLPVKKFIHPDQFAEYEKLGIDLGFQYVASGPLVRSSYKAGEFFIKGYLERRIQQSEESG